MVEEVFSSSDPWFGMDECGFTDLLSSVFGNGQDPASDEGVKIDSNLETKKNELIVMPPLSDIKKCPDSKTCSFSNVTFQLLNNYSKGSKLTTKDKSRADQINEGMAKLSTEEILQFAGERFIQFFINKADCISNFIHPYGSSLLDLSIEDTRDVELVYLLLAAAEYLASQKYDTASQLVSLCLSVASDSGSPVQRVAYYFAKALREKVDRETGGVSIEQKFESPNLEKGHALGTNNSFLVSHQKLPFVQVMQFAGVQAIIENMKASKRIHVVDLQIRSGIQWTALMQGLKEHRIKHLKITAVGTFDQRYMEETGKRLLSFAQSLDFPFSFNVVYLKDLKDFKEGIINIKADETIVVYSFVILRSMLSRPDCLESLMRGIKRLKPALMVVVEVEANHNSPLFVGRFIESLFFYGAYFDCFKDCLEGDSQCRKELEADYFGQGIMNVVATEGHERVTRNVNIDVWRAFLARFGMVEIALSASSRYQASLILEKFASGSSWNLEGNEKGLIVGWKGTPLHSLTVWKFT